jgi:tetratricopeptide (TPR) repeat protein
MEEIKTTDGEVIIDECVPFSQSKLWDFQRSFYFNESINAWTEKVPFYVTSNPYIANSYAHFTIRFIQDCLKNKSLDPKLPFYIVELGAGSGTFSFYLLNRILELKKLLSIDIKLVYVMTDLIQSNIDFWMNHEGFQPFVDLEQLDFACFDAEESTEIELIRSGVKIRQDESNTTKNPFIFIANYCFDSLRHDVFQVSNNKIYEGLCRSTTPIENFHNGRVKQLDKVGLEFEYHEISLPYYQHESLNELLLHYAQTTDNQYISFPIGSLMCIKTLKGLSNDKLLLISSDKGFSKHLEIYQSEEPELVFHDNCFSMSVNFDIIGQYFKFLGGDNFYQFTEQSLTTCAFLSGYKFDEMHETSLALETYLNSFGHTTINNLFLNEDFTNTFTSIESILPLLGASKWDVRVFNSCLEVLVSQVRAGYARISDIEDLKEKMPIIEHNFYKYPNTVDTFFDIGLFYQETMNYEDSLNYYEKSLSHFGEKENTLYNMGLCYYFLEQPEKAIIKFTQALKYNPDHLMARGWISKIESEKPALNKKDIVKADLPLVV